MPRLLALAAALIVLAPTAAAQPVRPAPSDAYAGARALVGPAELGLPAAGPGRLPVADGPVVVVADPDDVDRVAQIAFAALGLAAGTTAAVVGWPFVFSENEGVEEAEPVGGLADGFRYGVVLPVAVAGTALAAYSGVRLVVLVF